MSPQRRKLLLVLVLGLALPAGALLVIFGRQGYEQSKKRTGPPLLELAIAAHGGEDNLRGITTIQSRAIGEESGRHTEAYVSIALPDRYHHEVVTGDARLILASDGKNTWSTLDGVPVPVEDADLLRLQEQMAMARCGFLVGLEEDPKVTTTELGVRDGLDWLEVDFEESEVGPFLLGFDPETHLLARAEWMASMKGRFRKVAMSVAFSDYRAVKGIMIGFGATISVDGRELAKETLSEVTLGSDISPELFAQPTAPAVSPIMDRTSTRGPLVMLSEIPGDPADAEKIVSTFLDEFEISANGPAFRDVRDEKTIAVGVPVHLPKSSPPPPARTGAPRYLVESSQRMLTTVVTEADEEKLRAAQKRLLDHAEEARVEATGAFRHVTWKDSIVQVQLPVKGT